MCFFSRPSPPPLPEPRPTPPRPEKTAERVVVGTNRTTRPKSSSSETDTTKGETGKKRKGQRTTRARRLGTQSLRIPLSTTRNLRY